MPACTFDVDCWHETCEQTLNEATARPGRWQSQVDPLPLNMFRCIFRPPWGAGGCCDKCSSPRTYPEGSRGPANHRFLAHCRPGVGHTWRESLLWQPLWLPRGKASAYDSGANGLKHLLGVLLGVDGVWSRPYLMHRS